MAASRPTNNVDSLEQTINDVLIHIGKTIRAQTKGGRRMVALANATKIHDANASFNAALDYIETDILRARAVLRRDLEQLRAQKNAAAAAAAPKSETSTTPVQQAPPAPMDIDTEEPPLQPPSIAAKIKMEPAASNGQATMAPFPNMELDSPTVATFSAAPAVPTATTAPTLTAVNPKTTSPLTVKKESPLQTTRPTPTPPAARLPAAATAAMVPPRKSSSPQIPKAPISAANSRPVASPAMTKVPSPVLVKSATASPAIAVARPATSQPATPIPISVAGAAGRAISLSSSASPPSAVSPVMTKKTATPTAAPAAKTTQTQPRMAAPAPAPVSAPDLAPASAPTAPVPTMNSSADSMMDEFFDLTGPSTSGEHDSSDLGFTDMQFSLVSTKNDDAIQNLSQKAPVAPAPAQPQQPQPQQQQPQQQKPQQQQPQPQTHFPVQLPPQIQQPVQPPQAAHDDSEFDVEKFAADAAQNLMMDASFPSGPQQPPQQQPPPTTQPATQQQAEDSSAGATDNGDDLFKFLDDSGDILGDDPTNFDELYMGVTDDLDNYFDTA